MNSVAVDVESFEPLSGESVASAWRLSTQAGWNQTEEDWGRLLRMKGTSVKVLVRDGEVRASYSVVGYGPKLAWIGMILVDEAYRGGGWGKAAFTGALREAAGFETVGLDATNLGEPIYLKQGFAVGCSIVRWKTGSPGLACLVPPVPKRVHEGIFALDAGCTGVDRAGLLTDLADSGAAIFRWEEQGETRAYGVVRPGRTAAHLGPVVANSVEGFAAVLDQALEFCQGGPLICDAVSADAEKILAGRGMEPVRFLKRMTRPLEAMCLSGPGLWCGAGFELG